MSREIKKIEQRSNSGLKSKPATKSPLKSTNSEEAILRARKHTTPVPFALSKMIKGKKPVDVSILNINLKSNFAIPDQISARHIPSVSPRRSAQRSPRLYKSSMRAEAPSSRALKRVQFQIKTVDNLNGTNKRKQWKKIFSSIKSSFMPAPAHYNLKDEKKKTRYTIKEIIQM
jgi:hypothetical protein